ncbi:MAG: rRNA maturation RNase YbeY [Acidobacteriota bacterium]|nr:MAG: rRNA maturation RNase YbeY [Acidobacteriota bacterium]
MIDVVNLQRKVKLDTAGIRAFAASLPDFASEASGKTFTVAFVSDKRMRQLNEFFRGKDATTDVLSFPHEPDEFDLTTDHRPPTPDFLGDIVISAEQAERQAKENKLSLELEIKQLILHGLLHLCGYDHETDNGEMNARELELRDRLGING